MDSQKSVTLKLAHLADIHIQDMRRGEYAEVFTALYASLWQEGPDLIVVAGDVLDKNTKASAHNIEDTAQFLMKLSDIAPVVMITGNHDTNCLTPGALDLLTPIVKFNAKLEPPRLTYWRNSGVYAAHGLLWVVIAPDGPKPSQSEIITAARDFGLEAAPWVCLFHEEVDGARFPNGQMMRAKLAPKGLELFDIAIGGHIHLRQNITPRAAYCGSLVQQNFGEKHAGHGYLVWTVVQADVPNHRYRTEVPDIRGVDIQNDWGGFARIEMVEGAEVTEQPVPKKPISWEVIHDAATDEKQISSLVAVYTARFQMPPRIIRLKAEKASKPGEAPPRASNSAKAAETALLVRAQEDARDLQVHEEVVRGLLGPDHPRLADVVKMHKERYKAVIDALPRRARIRLLSLSFTDLYCFGPGNVIDFEKLEGCVSGVIAPNYSGKSSLIDIILFALYDVHPRARTKDEMIRADARSYRLVLKFELDGKEGIIEKGNTRSKTPVSLYRFVFEGVDRTKGSTPETVAEIATVIGDFNHAISCAVMLQDSGTELVTSTAAIRKKLLSEILALGAFARIERATVKEYTSRNSEVKTLNAQFAGQTLESIEEELDNHRGDMDDARLENSDNERCLQGEKSVLGGARKALGETRGCLRTLTAQLDYASHLPELTITAAEASEALQQQLQRLGLNSVQSMRDEFEHWKNIPVDSDLTVAEQPPTFLEATSAATELVTTRSEMRQCIQDLAKKQKDAEIAVAVTEARMRDRQRNHEEAEAYRKTKTMSRAELQEKSELEAKNLPQQAVIAEQIIALRANAELAQKNYKSCPEHVLEELRQLSLAKLTELSTEARITPSEANRKLKNVQMCHAAILGTKHLRDRLRFSEHCKDCTTTAHLLSAEGAEEIIQEIARAEQVYENAVRAYAAGQLVRYKTESKNLEIAQANALQIGRLRDLRAKKASYDQAEINVATIEQSLLESKECLENDKEMLRSVFQENSDASTGYRTRENEMKKIIGARISEVRAAWRAAEAFDKATEAETRHKERDRLQWEIEQKKRDEKLISQRLDESEKKVSELTVTRGRLMQQISEHAIHIARLEERYAFEGKRSTAHAKALIAKETLEAYRKVLNTNGGIADQLLSRARPSLEGAINESLIETGAQFKIKISEDFDILHTTARGKLLPVALASGYQRFALALAMRLALWRLASVPLPDMLVVDEGFASCDEGNQEALGQLLEGLAAAPAAPRVVFAVSHLEALKARVARPLTILAAPGGNRVCQAPDAPSAAAKAAEPTGPPAVAPAVKPAVKLAVKLAPPKRAPGRPRKVPTD